jgi:tRNA A-37 threonylcarbamoyl transferase component Bud32
MPRQAEVEQLVRDRLYGEPAEVRAEPMPRRALGTQWSGGGPAGGRAGGRYRFLERAGAGGMATVYRALDERLKREVAVKVIAERFKHDPRFVSRFRREAQLCARLSHPSIVGILDAAVEPRDFIVMELVDGVDAGTLLETNGPFTAETGVRVLTQVCDALAHAHDRSVVHHDVTPGNILISLTDGRAWLADFGLASDPTDGSDGPVEDVTGTPGFIAPEILHGAAPSPRSEPVFAGRGRLPAPGRAARGAPARPAGHAPPADRGSAHPAAGRGASRPAARPDRCGRACRRSGPGCAAGLRGGVPRPAGAPAADDSPRAVEGRVGPAA